MAGKEIRAGKAFVEIVLRDKLQAGLKRAAAQLHAFARVTSTIGAGLTAASGAILGPLTAAVSQFSSAGDAVHKMAARTGLSAEAISQLAHAANLSGTSVEILETGVRKMQQTLGEAATGTEAAAEALAKLGLSASGLLGLAPDKQLEVIADRIAAIESPALRTAVAMEIFGRSGTQLLPMFADGAAGIQAMRKQADDLGMTLSTDMANSAAKLTDALGTMWSTVKALTLNVGAALAPMVTKAADRISAAVASVTKFVRQNQQLVVTVAGVAAVIGGAGAAFLTIGGAAAIAGLAVSGLASAAGLAATVLSGIGAAVATVVSPLGLVLTALGAGAAAWLYFSGVGGRAIAWLQSRFSQLVGFVRTVVGGIGDALMAGDLQLAARIAWSGIKVAFYRGATELAGVWATVQSAASQTWTAIRSAVGQTVTWMSGQWEAIRTTAMGVWQAVAGSAASAFTRVRAVVELGLSTAADTAARAWATIVDVIASMPSRIQAALSTVGSAVGLAFAAIPSVIRTVAGSAFGLLVTTFRQLPSAVQNIAGAIGQVFREAVVLVGSVLGGLARTAYAYLQPIVAIGRVVFGALAAVAKLWFSTVAAVFSAVAPVVLSVWKRLFNLALSLRAVILSVRSTIMSASSVIVATIGRSASAAIQTASSILGGLIRVASRIASMTLGPFQGLVAAIGNLFATVVEEGGQILGTVLGKLYGFVASAIAILARPMDTLRSVWNGITSAVTGVASGIARAFRTAVAWVQSSFSTLWQWLTTTASQSVSLLGQAFTALSQGIVNAFSSVTGFLGNTFRAYLQSGSAVAAGLSSAFGSFKSSATESLSAIAKAMMHGEFALAGEVAWTSIKLAFVQGIAWITNAWSEFAAGLATIFDGVVVAIRTAWNNLTVSIGQLLMYQVARVQTLLDQLAQFDPTGVAAKLRSALDVNVGGTITAMEQDRERFNRGLADAREKRDSERAAHMQARLAETEARLAELRRQREDALARVRTAVDTAEKEGGGSPLTGAMDDLRKALAEAAAAPKLFDAGAATDKLAPAAVNMDEMMLNSGTKGLSSQGTFSAAAVWGLAAGGVNERAAKAAEATAQNTRQLVDHARRGRLVFG